ncbi:MAG: hypothetical protein WC343_04490 [Bacilli bacterium]
MSPEEITAYREWVRIMEFKDNAWPYMALAHIDQQAALIKELDDAVSGPLENIAKMLETVNADTIFSGIIQTWKNENGTLKTRIAELEKDLEATEKRVREHEEHENQTHEILGKILGTDNTLENVARRAISKITELEKKNAVLEAQVTTLKKIAISERSRCIRTESYDHCEGMYRIDLPEAIESSRRQLAEEHPEAF